MYIYTTLAQRFRLHKSFINTQQFKTLCSMQIIGKLLMNVALLLPQHITQVRQPVQDVADYLILFSLSSLNRTGRASQWL
jgi:hypothetical protein